MKVKQQNHKVRLIQRNMEAANAACCGRCRRVNCQQVISSEHAINDILSTQSCYCAFLLFGGEGGALVCHLSSSVSC